MNALTNILFALGILMMTPSCTTNSEKEKHESPTKTNPQDKPCFDCFFYLFEKYEQDYDANKVLIWKDSIINLYKEGKPLAEHSVFNKNGGGPLGAQWNSNAPIFCVMEISKDSAWNVYLDDTIINFEKQTESYNEQKNIVLFSITAAQWTEALKPITEDDYHEVYSSEEIENLSSVENSPLGVGEFVKLKIINKSTGEVICDRVLHVAFGE